MGLYKLVSQKEEKMSNDYANFTSEFGDGKLFQDSNSNLQVSNETLKKWLSDPETYLEDLTNYMLYMFISNGTISQLYTIYKSLPNLNYRIKLFEEESKMTKQKLLECDKILSNIRYKVLTRDIIGQLASTGNVICIWLGNKANHYLYTFNSLKYVFSPYRRNGQWVAVLDLDWLANMKEEERNGIFKTFSSIQLERAYKEYDKNKSKDTQYIELPVDRTIVIKNNTIYRNQILGLPDGIQALFDIKHKETLRSLEENIIDKIIKSIAILTIGNKEHDYHKIGSTYKRDIIKGVKSAIQQSINAKGVPVAVMPNYSNLNFPDLKGLDVFKDGADKFEDVNNSIQSSIGMNGTLMGSSNGSSYQSASLSLDMTYKKIDMMLELIEEVFQKLLQLVLGKKVAQYYVFEFAKGTPLTNKEELEVLLKLHSEGTSYKSLLDMLSNLDYIEFLNHSCYEINTLKTRENIIPPRTSSTLSSDNDTKKDLESKEVPYE